MVSSGATGQQGTGSTTRQGQGMSTVRFGILASVWTAAALAILQLRNVRFEHAFCLPGRCGPPLGALLSIQLFLAVGSRDDAGT